MSEQENEQIQADPQIIEADEAAVLNRKVAGVAGSYFRALADLANDEIYALAFTEAGVNSPRLLEIVNKAFTGMIAEGGTLPRVHFDSYKKLVNDFNNTMVFNLDSKLEANLDTLIAKVTKKTADPDRISHQDIIDALS